MRHMFEWYKKAEKCYVYLDDVYWDDSKRSWDQFRHNKWHKCGWTLQEMLASLTLEFYDCDGQCIDDKHSLSRDLADIKINKANKIPENAIRDCTLVKKYSRAERLRWADGRNCSYGPDHAYCMIGLCDVPIRPQEDETRAAAWQRLFAAIDEQEEKSLNRSIVKTGLAYGAIQLADWDVEESLETKLVANY